MASLDANMLLAEISPDQPCGENLEYDPRFLELEQAVHGKPDAQYGDTFVPATSPDWKVAQNLSLELLERTRDLRVAVHLARALLNCRGFGGLAEGLALIEGLIAQHWERVYPLLDSDDEHDPTERVNALAALVDQAGLIADVRDAPLVISRMHGAVRLRDIEYATGDLATLDGGTPPSLASIEAVLDDVPDDVRDTLAALRAARQSNARIETLLTERVGTGRAIDLSALSRVLQHAAHFIGERAGAQAPQAVAPGVERAGAADAAAAAPAVPAPAARASGEVESREDVIRSIDRICAYYERHEPSSPVPLLLARARRLVDKSFIEILQDLAPEGLGQARQVGGIESE